MSYPGMKNRSVIEIMVISMTLLVMFFIVGTTLLVILIEARDPDSDTSGLTDSLTSAILLILGALMGLLAGNTTSVQDLSKRPEETVGEIGHHRKNGE